MDYAGFETLIAEFGTGDKNTALEFRIFMSHLINCIFQPGDIKAVYCTAEDLENDYDATGLGIGKRAGWGKCNGIAGRITIVGRTIIGHGDTYPDIGAMGGYKEHTLTIEEMPQHDHDLPIDGGGSNDWQSLVGSANNDEGFSTHFKTDKKGGNQPHNNMQPYIVLLYIQKL